MLTRFQLYLGRERFWALGMLLVVTGGISLVLLAFDTTWSAVLQTMMALVFVFGSGLIFGSRLSPFQRTRWATVLLPALGLVLIGLFLAPQFLSVLTGAGAGWVIAALLLFNRSRAPQEYRLAIKAMRRNDYATAVSTMDALIKVEPKMANHYRFRAELLRLWGKLGRARRDYEIMIELEPDSPVAWNGLSEVQLQAGNYTEAQKAGLSALELAPESWAAMYNLGLVYDRQHDPVPAIETLQGALSIGVPDRRHRLLVVLYLTRNQLRLGQRDSAAQSHRQLLSLRNGVRDWEQIINSDQADTLRSVLGDDITLAKRLAEGELSFDTWAQSFGSGAAAMGAPAVSSAAMPDETSITTSTASAVNQR